MQLSRTLALGLASLAAAQSNITLLDALKAQGSVSTLTALLAAQPDILRSLGDLRNVTVLAPSNTAIGKYFNQTANVIDLATNPEGLAALLSFHVLNGTHYASSFTNQSAFLATHLTDEAYTNVTGGQRVQALTYNNTVVFYSALKENSTVVTPNLNFTGGTVHIVDSVLTIPTSVFDTLEDGNLTAAAGAIRGTGAESKLNDAKDITVFAPDNGAFNKIGNITGALTSQQLSNIINYHVVQGRVDYSTLLSNTTLQSAAGGNLTISQINGTFYVNSAKIVIQDVLVANGVVHVIDNVLNPDNTAPAVSTVTSQAPAFSGAGTGSAGVPFTSGIAAPTSTAPVATSANPGGVTSQTSSQLAPPMRTGAVGVAALFGAAAIAMNM